jgi:hypothetical protein
VGARGGAQEELGSIREGCEGCAGREDVEETMTREGIVLVVDRGTDGGLTCSSKLISAKPSDDTLRLLCSGSVTTVMSGLLDLRLRVDVLPLAEGTTFLASIHRDLRRFVPSTISSHTAVTYLGVAPRLIKPSGAKPSYRSFRMISMYSRASSGEISTANQMGKG